MKYWRINTDRDARDDVRTCDLWYRSGMVLTGDQRENERKHASVFLLLSPGDGVFMHHSRLGVVGYGVVTEKWDQKIYKDIDRLLYMKDPYEYRISVDWDIYCDCREQPLPIYDRLPYRGTYCEVDPGKWDIDSVLDDLRKRGTGEK
jgi:hypothetical protein